MAFVFGLCGSAAGFGTFPSFSNSVPQFGAPAVPFGAVGTPYLSQPAAVPFGLGGMQFGAADYAEHDKYVYLARDPVSKLCAAAASLTSLPLRTLAASFLTLCACTVLHTLIA